MEKAKVWFIRMALDLHCNVMACGNTLGQVFLWDMHSLADKPVAVLSRECTAKAQGKAAPNITVCFPWCMLLGSQACLVLILSVAHAV